MTRFLTIAAAGAVLGLAGCGDDGNGGDGSPDAPASNAYGGGAAATEEATEAADAAKPRGTEVALGDSQFGSVLFDGESQAIYIFDKEAGPKSECYGACAEAWPPVLTEGEPQPGGGVKGSLLGITEREDGSAQVTYKGQPLYYYAHEGPGEVTCHNVDEFGGLWLAIDASGDPV